MKRMKKIMALMLAAIMMMAMSVTAFAAETTHSLTVNVKGRQDLKGQTINLYKLFDVTESKSGETTNYAYTVNTAEGYKDALASVLGSPITASSTDEQFAAAVLALSKVVSICPYHKRSDARFETIASFWSVGFPNFVFITLLLNLHLS